MDDTSSKFTRARTALGLDDSRLIGMLVLLWTTTAAYIALHLSHRLVGAPWSPLFDLSSERGYGEVFFQTLTAWTILLLLIAAVRLRAGVLLIWAGAAAYLLADDYFLIHERIGTWFASTVLYVGKLSTHIGETLWLGVVGVVLIIALAVGYKLARREVRRITVTVGILFAALAGFGVIVDAVHSPFIDVPFFDPLFIALEDGGEIAVMSVLVVYLTSLAFPAAQVSEAAGVLDSAEQDA